MKLMIISGEKYRLSEDDLYRLDDILEKNDITEVASNYNDIEAWADYHNIPTAAYSHHDFCLGAAFVIALFPGADVNDEAMLTGNPIFDFREK